MRRAVVAALCACAAGVVPSDSAEPGAEPPALVVEASGCEAVALGPVCEIGAGATLTVWARSDPDARLAVLVRGAELADEGAPVQGGRRWRVTVSPESERVTVTAARGAGARGATWSMAVRASSREPEIQRADALRRTKPGEAEALAAKLVGAAGARTRADARGILGRIRRAEGKPEEAIAALREAAEQHRAAGWPSEALKDELALAFTALEHTRAFDEARAALDRARALGPSVPDGEAQTRYYAGLLALETGDYRTAERALQASLLASERVQLHAYLGSTATALAALLQLFGRDGRGVRLLGQAERLLADVEDPCTRALIWDVAGWFRLNARASAGDARARAGDAHAALEKALAEQRDGCASPELAATILTDLAVLAMREGRTEEALGLLREARAAQPEADSKTRAWWLDVQGQIDLAHGSARAALATYEELAAHAAAAALPEAQIRAALGRARSLEALGRPEAGEAYEEAERILERRALFVPAHEGRLGFFATFDEVAQAGVAHFAKRDVARAGAFARRALARNLAVLGFADRIASLPPAERPRWEEAIVAYGRGRAALEEEAQGDWKLSQEEHARALQSRKERGQALIGALEAAIAGLWRGEVVAVYNPRPPDAGELILVLHPGNGILFVFVMTRAAARVLHAAPLARDAPPAAWAKEVLEPLREEIEAAARIRIEAPSSLDAVDFHALPWDGAPLLAKVPVVYGIHAGSAAADRHVAAGRALVVGDPREDLAAARREARAVVAALAQGGVRADELVGPAATHGAVVQSLRRADLALLHYAGHGELGGDTAWEAGLPLAAGGFLAASDILTLPRAPEVVVLSGCETARAEPSASDAGLGIAHAFLVVGSRAVVASPRAVGDRAAAAFAEALYASDAPDWAERARRASLAVRERMPGEDWAAFRAVVR